MMLLLLVVLKLQTLKINIIYKFTSKKILIFHILKHDKYNKYIMY